MQKEQQKNLYVILGVGRSGTSAVARGLKAIGIHLGDIMRAANETNPKGFWEDSAILALNRIISRAIHDPAFNVSFLAEHQSQYADVFNKYKPLALQLLQRRLANQDNWAFKDPRTVVLLPFWKLAFKELNVVDNYIITVRHPLAAARSNQKFNQQDVEMNLLVWLVNMVATIEETIGKNRIVVSFEKVLQEPRHELMRIRKNLGINLAVEESEIAHYANEFLDKSLQHHHIDDELTLDVNLKIAPLCAQLYALLLKLSNDEIAFDSEEFKLAWQQIKAVFDVIYPIYHYVHTLTNRNQQLQKKLHTIQKSVPWILVRPLRIIDDALRAFKKTSRDKRRLLKLQPEK